MAGIIRISKIPIVILSEQAIEILHTKLNELIKRNNLTNNAAINGFMNELEVLNCKTHSTTADLGDYFNIESQDLSIFIELLSQTINEISKEQPFAESEIVMALRNELILYKSTMI